MGTYGFALGQTLDGDYRLHVSERPRAAPVRARVEYGVDHRRLNPSGERTVRTAPHPKGAATVSPL
jgi:hypothetical protein